MRWFTVLSLLVVCFVCLSVAQVTFDDCCLKYGKKMNRGMKRHVVDYIRQELDGDCNLPAIIFVMKKGRVYCTNPSERWVQQLMRTIDKKYKYGKEQIKG